MFLVKTIKDMLSLDTIKLALLTGIPLLLIWIGLGWLFWDPVTKITYDIITWIPFSIVRANGAFIITFFIWFVLVLASYAVFVGLFSAFIMGGKRESKFEAINFTLILIFAIAWALFLLLEWPIIHTEMIKFLTLLPFDTVSKGISWLLAFYLFYNLFLISEYLTVFMFRDAFIAGLLERHTGEIEFTPQDISNTKTYATLYKDIIWFFMLSILIVPVLFIPVANFLALWFVWAWLYKESAFLGVCSLLCNTEEYKKLREHKLYLFSTSLVSALLNFIPIINVFTPFFVMSLHFHWILEEKSLEEDQEDQTS